MACMHICHACIQASINDVILVGVHASLSNIDDDGCFIPDEVFELPGKTAVRKAGAARALMDGWRKLRPQVVSVLEAHYIDDSCALLSFQLKIKAFQLNVFN